MKAITLVQPWASLVILGAKHIETRSWNTKYRGKLAIHAGKKWNKHLADLCEAEPFRSALYGLDGTFPEGRHSNTPLGMILGTVELVDCVATEDLLVQVNEESGPEFAFGDYRPGRWGWLLQHAQLLTHPVPFVGRQGLWDVPDEVIANAAIHAMDG